MKWTVVWDCSLSVKIKVKIAISIIVIRIRIKTKIRIRWISEISLSILTKRSDCFLYYKQLKNLLIFF